MEKIEKLASLLARIADVQESDTPYKTISESLAVLNEDIKDEPNEGWFDYVLKRYAGEPATLDWALITLADLGVEMAIEKCRQKYKNNEYIRFKKTGAMYEELEDKDAEIVDGDLEDIDDETMEKICGEIETELKRTGDDEVFHYANFTDDDIDAIDKACADAGIYSYEPDAIDDDDYEGDLFLATTLDLAQEYDDLEEQLAQANATLTESTTTAKEKARLIEEVMNKEKLRDQIKEHLIQTLGEGIIKNIGDFIRNSVKRKQMMKAMKGRLKMAMKRAKLKVSAARALKVARRAVRNAMLMKKAKVKSMEEFRALSASVRLKWLTWISQKGLKARIERKAKQALAPTMKRLRAKAQELRHKNNGDAPEKEEGEKKEE